MENGEWGLDALEGAPQEGRDRVMQALKATGLCLDLIWVQYEVTDEY